MSFSKQSLKQALRILESGGIVAHATETCYGFACDLTSPGAVKRLFELKKRPFDSPVSALFESVEAAKKFVEWNEEAESVAKKHLPGPLTLILPVKKNSPPLFIIHPSASLRASYPPFGFAQGELPTTHSVGIRVSSHPVAQKLASAFGKPLSTTSANLHGFPNAYSSAEMTEQFARMDLKPDLVLDSGPLEKNPPSTVIDMTSPGNDFLRTGSVTKI